MKEMSKKALEDLDRLLEGKSTINEVRQDYGLLPLRDELTNVKFSKGVKKMIYSKRIITEQAETDLVEAILEQVRKHNMTIINLKESVAKAVDYLELNATLEGEDLAITKSSIQD